MAYAYEPGKGFRHTDMLNSLGLVGDVSIPVIGMDELDVRKKELLQHGMSGLGLGQFDWIPEGSVNIGGMDVPYWALIVGGGGVALLFLMSK